MAQKTRQLSRLVAAVWVSNELTYESASNFLWSIGNPKICMGIENSDDNSIKKKIGGIPKAHGLSSLSFSADSSLAAE